ncbi:MAG: sensor histidine kinase [Actinomycetota bacterium]
MLRQGNPQQIGGDERLELVASAAHDLQVPLRSISQFCSYLRRESMHMSPEEIERSFDAIMASTDRLEHFVADILDLARLESGGIAFDIHRVEIAQVVDTVLQLVSPPESWHLELDISPGLSVWADPLRLEQIITNLVTNSFHHGDPPLRIQAGVENGMAFVFVGDDGPGLPEHSIRRLFSAFERGASASIAGTGLGLSIAARLAGEMDGTLTYVSGSNHGFRVLLPLPQS